MADKALLRKIGLTMIVCLALWNCRGSVLAEHAFNRGYTGNNLDQIAFPIGGIGAGMYCLEGTGTISHVSVKHHLERYNEPTCFAAICIKGASEAENTARVVEGPVPDWKYFSIANAGMGSGGRTYGLPRFRECRFSERFPFCSIELTDESLPICAVVTGFSPFIPTCADRSSLPAGSIDYAFTNTSGQKVAAVFSFHSRNFMGDQGVGAFPDGFRLKGSEGEFAFALKRVWRSFNQLNGNIFW